MKSVMKWHVSSMGARTDSKLNGVWVVYLCKGKEKGVWQQYFIISSWAHLRVYSLVPLTLFFVVKTELNTVFNRIPRVIQNHKSRLHLFILEVIVKWLRMHEGSSMIYEIYVGLHLYQFELLLLSLSKLILTLEIQQDWKSI